MTEQPTLSIEKLAGFLNDVKRQYKEIMKQSDIDVAYYEGALGLIDDITHWMSSAAAHPRPKTITVEIPAAIYGHEDPEAREFYRRLAQHAIDSNVSAGYYVDDKTAHAARMKVTDETFVRRMKRQQPGVTVTPAELVLETGYMLETVAEWLERAQAIGVVEYESGKGYRLTREVLDSD